MKAFLTILAVFFASQSSAQDGAIRGRMICEVTGSRFVAASDGQSNTIFRNVESISPGATLTFDYTLDEASRLSIFLRDTNRGKALVDEQFSAKMFRGISWVTNKAEFRATYSEASFGKFRINYKGSDQLYLKRCQNDYWSGHYLQTYASGKFTQVVSLNCRPFVDTVDDVLARLTILQ